MRIILLGDSLTEYGDWQQRLPRFAVTNLGRAGETVEGLLCRVKAIGGGIGHADHIFVMSGINNIAAGETGFLVPYRELLFCCHSLWPRSPVVAQSILPVCADWIDRGSIVAANEELRRMAQDLLTAYLDVYGRFMDSRGETVREYFLDDGLHLSASGYRRWAKAIEEHLAGAGSPDVSR